MFPDLRPYAVAHLAALLLPSMHASVEERRKAIAQAGELLKLAEEEVKRGKEESAKRGNVAW